MRSYQLLIGVVVWIVSCFGGVIMWFNLGPHFTLGADQIGIIPFIVTVVLFGGGLVLMITAPQNPI